MARGFLDTTDTFHWDRDCPQLTEATHELPITTALKWDASLCDTCEEEP